MEAWNARVIFMFFLWLNYYEIANKSYYDRVTDFWRAVSGDNLHWGYFESNDGNLRKATDALII